MAIRARAAACADDTRPNIPASGYIASFGSAGDRPVAVAAPGPFAVSWAAGVSGDWNIGANWNGGAAPNALSFVTVAATGTYTVSISKDSDAQTLTISDASATVSDAGSLLEIGTTLAVASGTLALSDGASVTGELVNVGVLGTLSASGGGTIGATVTTAGMVDVVSGVLEFDGGGTLGGGFTGGGTLALAGGVFKAAAGAVFDVSDLAAFGRTALSFGTGSDVLIEGNLTLGLAGRAFDGPALLQGPGTFTTGGTTVIAASNLGTNSEEAGLSGSITWINGGTVKDRGLVLVGGSNQADSVTVINQAGASFYLTGDNASVVDSTVSSAGVFNFSNAGTLAKTSGTGTSTMQMNVDNTGLIYVVSGTLELTGGGTLGGAIGGAGTLALGGGAFAITLAELDAINTQMLVAGGNLVFGGPSGALTAPIDIQYGTLSVSSSFDLTVAGALGQFDQANSFFTLSGGGTVTSTGTTTIQSIALGGGVTWINQGTANLPGDIVVNTNVKDSFKIVNDAGATFNLVGFGISRPLVGSSDLFINAGTVSTTGGTSQIDINIYNTGVINVSAGHLTLGGAVAGSGVIDVGGAATLSLAGVLSGQIIDFLPGPAAVRLGSTGIKGTFSGFGPGDTIYLPLNTTGFSYSDGILTVDARGGKEVSLHFAGSYTMNDFSVSGGTISFI